MPKTFKGDVTNNVVELNLLDGNISTLPNLGTPTIVTKNTGPNVVEQIVGDIPANQYFSGSNGGYDVKGLVIGTSCTSIGSNAFYYCFALTGSLTIPNSVTTIGSNAFYMGLFNAGAFSGTLTIGNSVTTIGSNAFLGCTGFTGNLTIPDSVETIGSYAFYYCPNFNGHLTIPNSVTSISFGAFESCWGLTAVYTNTPASSFTGSNAFLNTVFTTIYTGPNATGYTSSFQGRTGLTISPWTNYPNIP